MSHHESTTRVLQNSNAGVRIQPQTRAVALRRRVPAQELRRPDPRLRRDRRARVAAPDIVERLALRCHVCLDRRRRGHAVALRGGGAGAGAGADDGNADVVIEPEVGARGADRAGFQA